MFVKMTRAMCPDDSTTGFEAVADPGFGEDVTGRRSFRLQFFAQLADEHPKVCDLLGALTAPDGAEKIVVGYYFARMADQVDK
jgi:hypothetical protein